MRPARSAGQAELGILFRRQVDDDEAVDSGFDCVGEEAVDAVNVDRVVVAHQHDRRRVVAAAKPAHEIERLHHGLAGVECAQSGSLDRRAVGHRIGEGHADFDDVGAGLRQGLDDRKRSSRIGIAGHQEGHEPATPFGGECREFAVDAGGHPIRLPRCSATVKMSLSPRPHMFITIR